MFSENRHPCFQQEMVEWARGGEAPAAERTGLVKSKLVRIQFT